VNDHFWAQSRCSRVEHENPLRVKTGRPDNVLASAMLTEHLIRFGHRRIAHIAGRAGLYAAGACKASLTPC
jgi:DNA-binding LacI/PurR family transcriptional regulator